MNVSNDKDMCLCSSIPQSSSYSSLAKDVYPKYYQEIGAEMLSNQLIIRLEKDKNRRKKKLKEWDPPCDCVEIQRPTSKKGPKIINADYEDRIVFRVHSASRFYGKEDSVQKPQTIAYKIGSCTEKEDSHQCKTITVYPQFISGTQEVYSDHITEGNQDIFLLRIKKKAEPSEQSNRNVELEVRTPKPPTLSLPPSLPVIASPQPVRDSANVENAEKPNKNKDNKLNREPVQKHNKNEGKNRKRKKKK